MNWVGCFSNGLIAYKILLIIHVHTYTMTQGRLNELDTTIIKNHVSKNIKYKDIIADFILKNKKRLYPLTFVLKYMTSLIFF